MVILLTLFSKIFHGEGLFHAFWKAYRIGGYDNMSRMILQFMEWG